MAAPLAQPLAPVFEAGWNCSAECTEARLQAAVRRELEGAEAAGAPSPSHSAGFGDAEQGGLARSCAGRLRRRGGRWRPSGPLAGAPAGCQREAGNARTRLAMELSGSGLEYHDAEALTGLLPRLFVDAFGALPLRVAREAALPGIRGASRPGACSGRRAHDRAAGRKRPGAGNRSSAAHTRMLRRDFRPSS